MEITQEPTKKSQRDIALIREALENNNQQAYAELMENYRESLYLMMLKMVNNPYDAEDLPSKLSGKFSQLSSLPIKTLSVHGSLKLLYNL
jgi:RNA polymerase sigma-70 factor (ECF subfamily)